MHQRPLILFFSSTFCLDFSMRFLRLIFPLFILLALAACTEPKTPEETAKRFWTALQHQNADAAQNLAIDGSVQKLLQTLQPKSFQLSALESNGNRATIQTTVQSAKNRENQEILLTTVLYYHNEKWRVSVKQTENSLLPGTFRKLLRDLEEIGNHLGNAIDSSKPAH